MKNQALKYDLMSQVNAPCQKFLKIKFFCPFSTFKITFICPKNSLFVEKQTLISKIKF